MKKGPRDFGKNREELALNLKKESLDEYLARGGTIQKVAFNESTNKAATVHTTSYHAPIPLELSSGKTVKPKVKKASKKESKISGLPEAIRKIVLKQLASMED